MRTYECPFCHFLQKPDGEVDVGDILFCVECGSVIGKVTKKED